jgi:hypothetical protein
VTAEQQKTSHSITLAMFKYFLTLFKLVMTARTAALYYTHTVMTARTAALYYTHTVNFFSLLQNSQASFCSN